MRPINKGRSPYSTISAYNEALPFLESAIGLYCSYCEYPIGHAPEVEHIVSKSAGGELTAWENLLVSCKYCNTRKKAIVNKTNVDEYLWPDRYNTALAYNYENGVPTVNEDALIKLDPSGSALKKAQNLFDLVKLGNVPPLKGRDRRARSRNSVFEIALDSLATYQNGKEIYHDNIELLAKQIVQTAISNGFFSIWTTVFADEPEILHMLIDAFPGTEKAFYDESGLPKSILTRTQELSCV